MTSEKPPTPTDDELPQTNREGNIDGVPVNGHISQIPGLSPALKALTDERVKGRRVGVLESDSEYVKLAKQGGHKGLLWHSESVTSSHHAYKAPDWFSLAAEGNDSPSLINSEHKRSPRAFQRREPPFGSDNMSAWERNDSSGGGCSGPEKNNDILDSPTENLPSQKFEGSKFRRIVFDKKPPPVDMSKLLSFGYAGDCKPTVSASGTNQGYDKWTNGSLLFPETLKEMVQARKS